MKKLVEKEANMDEFSNSCFCFCFLSTCLFLIQAVSTATDSMNISHIIRDGETLVSSGEMFEFGFFSLGNSTNRYVGIWYKNVPVRTYVWVANRQIPLKTKSGVLKVTQPGILALFDYTNGTIIWSSNATRAVGNPVVQLLDTGNLVVKDANDDRPENFAWKSFDHPSDTLLPGMSIGWNFVTGVETYLSSWKSENDPAPGEYTVNMDAAGAPQLVVKRGDDIRCRIGPWNGIRFSGGPTITYRSTIYLGRIDGVAVMNDNEVKYSEDIADRSVVTLARVTWNGFGQRWILNNLTREWAVIPGMPGDDCDVYNSCGAYGICNIGNSPPCGCLNKFVSRDSDSANGCVRRTPLTCQDDVFLKYSGNKLPDARNSVVPDRRMSLAECEVECSRNCNCTAYTQLDIRDDGSGCLFYYGELKDIRTQNIGAQDLYIRMASSELDSIGKKRVILTASLPSAAGVVLVCLILVLIFTRKMKINTRIRKEGTLTGCSNKEAELPFFNLSPILKATDHFSSENKLGEGGFGPVYKGTMDDGQEIAVKRLSKTSIQGVDELKNEVILIAKLQHRNLVKLLGCCIEREEKMLIYEYMPNSSLDLILFDQMRSKLPHWQQRFQIINGIAKGLLYLHQDSRLRIIHRDLKASNILLDADMNPKISDFGLARSFGGNETVAKTRRVVGTYGYMSPEYAIDGLFSIKSDVFSFGVLVLEIVTGQRNRGFSLDDHNLNLLGYAWRLYQEDNALELVDASLGDSFDLSEVLRAIHVGLLCVQKRPEDRPNMGSVIFMLGNEVELPQAKEPGFFMERDVTSTHGEIAHSENQITITSPEGR